MTCSPSDREELVIASRILVHQRVLDAFGHVSFRDPSQPELFWLSHACPPSTVEANDLMAFSLDGEPVEPATRPLFSERYIHSEIYKARPDVMAICHHHAAALMPYCIADARLAAMSQTGAFMGERVVRWDSADEFGATNMLVSNPEQAASLAHALADRSIVLMRGHGTTVAGASVKDLVFKAVHACRDAEAHLAASLLGTPQGLSREEIAIAGEPKPPALERGWQHWCSQL